MKIQILELPMEHVGDYSTTPYAVILSEVPATRLLDYQVPMTTLKNNVESIKWFFATDDEVEI